MKNSTKNNRLSIFFLILSFFVFSNRFEAQSQITNISCFTDSLSLYNNGGSGPEDFISSFINSVNGGIFTPKGELRFLIIFAGFTNDRDKSNGIWPYYDQNGDSLNTFPTNINDYFYTNANQFSPQNTDKSLSNFYYQMSLPSGDPLKIIADVFPYRVNVTADLGTDTTGGLPTYTNWLMDSIEQNYPTFDFGPYDNRQNGPNFNFDNSNVATYPPDNKIDYTVVIWRYDDNPVTDPNLSPPNQKQLSDHPNSSGAVAGVPYMSHTNTSTSQTYTTNGGFTFYKGFNGLDKTTFTHEVGHTLYNSPHYNAANNVCGSYFYNNFGWGMMKSGGPHVFDCASGWERWYLGWIELTTGTSQVSTNIQTINDIQNGGVYTLRDYITTGDVMRIKLPFVNNEFLWLENHQGVSIFDSRDGWTLNGVSMSFPDAPRGLVGYVEKLHPTRNSLINFSNAANGIKYINANGNFDYSNQFSNPEPISNEIWGTVTYDFIKGNKNPLGSHNSLSKIRNNFSDIDVTNKINYHNYTNGCFGCIGNENRAVYKEDGIFTYGSLGIDMAFKAGGKVDLGSNPAITNFQTYNVAYDTLSPIYLNGLSFEVLSYNQDSITVKIRMDDYDVNNDTRYTGNIILSKHITNGLLPSLNIKQNKTLVIAKSGTPNKQYITSNNDFINNTIFTSIDSSYIHLESNSTLVIADSSLFVLKSGSKLELEDGAELFIYDGELIIEDGAELILHDGAKLTVDTDGKLTINNTTAGKGLIVGDNNITTNQAEALINGTLTFASNAIWEHFKSGFYNFSGTHTLTIPASVPVTFTGKSKTHKMLQISGGNLTFTGNTINWSSGLVYYDLLAQTVLNNANYTGNLLTFTAQLSTPPTSTGLNIYNPIKTYLTNCTLANLAKGIKITDANPITLLLGNTYTDNIIAVDLSNATHTKIAGSNFSSTIVGSIGIKAIESTQVDVTNTSITSFDKGSYFYNVDGVYFSNSNLYYNNIGIEAENTLLFIRTKTKIHQNTLGVELYGAYNYTTNNYSSMLTVGDVGCGAIYDNTVGVHGRDLILNIDAIEHAINSSSTDTIPNRFDNNSTYTFDICYTDYSVAPSQINAKSNYWGTTVIPTSNYRLKTNTDCIAKPNNGNNIPLITTPHSICTPSPSCMACKMSGGGGTSNPPGGGGGGGMMGLMVINAFQTANEPFVVEDNATTRQGFVDISAVGLLKDTLTDSWKGVTINNEQVPLDKKSVHRIQVAKAIKNATIANARTNYIVQDIFKGLEDVYSYENSIELFPNPVQNELNIVIDGLGEVSFVIYNLLGEKVNMGSFTNQIKVNTSQLQGVYFIELKNDKGELTTKKFIVNK